MIGQQLSSYHIEKQLTQREISDLYLGRSIHDNQPVLIEIVHPTLQESPNITGRFQRRIDIIARLKHPAIPLIKDTGITPAQQPYAVMEYITGSALKSNRVPLPPADAFQLIRPIVESLKVAHPAGIIHHNLQPDNIILRDDQPPALMDLSVFISPPAVEPAKTADKLLLDYASPEQLEGKPLSGCSNIYSLGIILYELLAGHRPQVPVSQWDIFHQMDMANLPAEIPLEEARPGLPPAVYELVQNCLWRQEWKRFETADSLLAAIDAAFIPPPAPSFLQRIQHHKRARYLLFILLALLLFLLAFWLIRRQTMSGQEILPILPPGITYIPPGSNLGQIPMMTAAAISTAQSQATIELLGPAPDTVFSFGDEVAFDWSWPTRLQTDERFTVYLISADTIFILNQVTIPTSGDIYRLQMTASDIAPSPGLYAWQVVLESSENGSLAASEQRNIIFITGTATATPFPTRVIAGTPTRRLTATPTVVTPTPTATPTASPTMVTPTPTQATETPDTPPSPAASRIPTRTPTVTTTPTRLPTRIPSTATPTLTATPILPTPSPTDTEPPPTDPPPPPPTDPPPTPDGPRDTPTPAT